MGIFNLFSKRQRALEAGPSDILIYDQLPQHLRVQIVHIVTDAFGTTRSVGYGRKDYVEEAYQAVHDVLCREYGLFNLNQHQYYCDRVANFILSEQSIERVLDTVELCFRFIAKAIPQMLEYGYSTDRKLSADDAVEELNQRFKEHEVGYQYEEDGIIKVDSTYVHSEIVKPTLTLLFNPLFSGANEEYVKAHEHYRHGRNKECLAECLKAFESTMKIICTQKGWAFSNRATSSVLVTTILSNNLIPSYLQGQFTSIRSLLESGIATIRNRIGGHGQGSTPTTADDETTRYGLNLTGANIIYLIELSKLI